MARLVQVDPDGCRASTGTTRVAPADDCSQANLMALTTDTACWRDVTLHR
jgi:hypothetical protein